MCVDLRGGRDTIRIWKDWDTSTLFESGHELSDSFTGKVKRDYGEVLGDLRAYLREMNGSEGLADDMLKVAPAEMRYLAYDDLNNYGLSYRDPVEQEAIDLQDARSLGLDRSEHVRRQAIQKTRCATLPDFQELMACNERVMKFGR